MRHLILVFLVIGSVMFFFSCQEESALAPELSLSNQVPVSLAKAKSSPNLIGTVKTDFTFTPPTFWNGTIDFGEDFGENHVYGITFYSYGAPRDYSQASPFEEDFYIYESGKDWDDPDYLYMKGSNSGVVSYANKAPDPVKFRANGKIEVANEPFAEWLGCNVHIRGTVTLIAVGVPKGASGTFRIN